MLSGSLEEVGSHTLVRHYFENVSRSLTNHDRRSTTELEDSGFQVCGCVCGVRGVWVCGCVW